MEISVIIPVYNHARELSRCVASLRNQTKPPSELIIVDDGSTDESADIAEQECRRGGPWQRCEVMRQPNSGAPVARNAGFERSREDLILFSDADIEWQPHALEKLQRALTENPSASYSYSSFYFGWKFFRAGAFDGQRLKKVNYVHTSALIRREHFPGFDPALKKFQDWDLWLTMLEQGHIGVWVDEPLFRVQPRRSGMSHWLPAALHRILWPWLRRTIPEIARYDAAAAVIRRKHHLHS